MRAVARWFVLALSFTRVSTADGSPSSSAEALFREGQALLEAGDAERACPKLEASQKLEPALGTLLNLAFCYERAGKTASAWASYSAASAQAKAAKRVDRERFARDRAKKLEPLLHRVKLEAKSLPADANIAVDGALLAPAALGSEIPLDPGSHRIEVSAPGRAVWTRELDVQVGAGLDVVEIPELEPLPSPPDGPVAKPEPPRKPPAKVRARHAPARKLDTAPPPPGGRQTLGFVVAGVGLVSLGASTWFALDMLAKKDERDELCPPGTPCHEPSAVDADRAARRDRTWALVFAGVGGVAAGAGAWLIFSAEGPGRSGVAVGPGPRLVWSRPF